MELHGVAKDGSTQAQKDPRFARILAGLRLADEELQANGGKVPERTTPVAKPQKTLDITGWFKGGNG